MNDEFLYCHRCDKIVSAKAPCGGACNAAPVPVLTQLGPEASPNKRIVQRLTERASFVANKEWPTVQTIDRELAALGYDVAGLCTPREVVRERVREAPRLGRMGEPDALCLALLRAMVSVPGDLRVERLDTPGMINLTIYCNPADRGIVIGKKGNNIEPLRVLMNHVSIRGSQRRTTIELARADAPMPKRSCRRHADCDQADVDAREGRVGVAAYHAGRADHVRLGDEGDEGDEAIARAGFTS